MKQINYILRNIFVSPGRGMFALNRMHGQITQWNHTMSLPIICLCAGQKDASGCGSSSRACTPVM